MAKLIILGCVLLIAQFSHVEFPTGINRLSLEKRQTQIEMVDGKTQLRTIPFQSRLCVSQEFLLTFQENQSFSNYRMGQK